GGGDASAGGAVALRARVRVWIGITVVKIVTQGGADIRKEVRMAGLQSVVHDADDDAGAPVGVPDLGDVYIDSDRAELPGVTQMPFAAEKGVVGQKPGLPLAGQLGLGGENPGARTQGVGQLQRVSRVRRLRQY